MSLTEDLVRSGLFKHLSTFDVDRLGKECREALFEPGETLIAMGDLQDAFHVIASGLVSVTKPVDGRVREVARLGPDSFVGEMAMLTDDPASANVVAVTRTRAIEVPRHVIDELATEAGIGLLLDVIVKRRQATNRLDRVAPIMIETGDGARPLLLRPVWPDDWRLMDASRDRVSDDTLRQRFFTLPKLHESFLRRLSTVDYLDQFAWALLDDEGDGLVAVGRYARLPDDRTIAEIALLVADDAQGKGLGGTLMTALAIAAQAHDVDRFTATALSDNQHVQRLLTRRGASWEPGDRGQEVTATWPVSDVIASAGDEHPVGDLRAAAQAILG